MKLRMLFLLITRLELALLLYFVTSSQQIKLELLLILNLEDLDSNHFDFAPLKPLLKHHRSLFHLNLKNPQHQNFLYSGFTIFNFIITNLVMPAHLVDYKLRGRSLKALTHCTSYILEYRFDQYKDLLEQYALIKVTKTRHIFVTNPHNGPVKEESFIFQL